VHPCENAYDAAVPQLCLNSLTMHGLSSREEPAEWAPQERQDKRKSVPLSVRQRICGNSAKQVLPVSPHTLEGAMGTSDATEHAMHEPRGNCAA